MAYFEKNALDHYDLFRNLRHGKTVLILKGKLILSTLDNKDDAQTDNFNCLLKSCLIETETVYLESVCLRRQLSKFILLWTVLLACFNYQPISGP